MILMNIPTPILKKFDPVTGTSSNWKRNMVANMDNVVVEDKIAQGEFQ